MNSRKLKIIHGVLFISLATFISTLVILSPRISRDMLKEQLKRFQSSMTFKPFMSKEYMKDSIFLLQNGRYKYISANSKVENVSVKQTKETEFLKTYKIIYTVRTDTLPNEKGSFTVELQK